MGCSGGLGAGTSAVSGIVVGVTFGFLLLGYQEPLPDRLEASTMGDSTDRPRQQLLKARLDS